MVDVLKWRPIKGRSHKNYQSKEFKKLCDCDSNLNFLQATCGGSAEKCGLSRYEGELLTFFGYRKCSDYRTH